ncbi:MAG TPA: 4-oxalomesaconate tautomerase [Alphaproteobacteria bacterium]|nr:4-oxalomesaconate tautomerase [Alphaproteobacteria bacterium]
MWMRGGTSKGAYFLADDLPRDKAARDALLLRIMGSPDPRQIDGMGGANPLTSKVAVISASTRPDADLDYLFLQVFVDKALVSDAQNCGNILAGVGAFAIERGLVSADDGITDIRIFMRNTGQVATASITTPNGIVRYDGDDSIDGVPGTAAPVPLVFDDIAGSMCGALLPTGNAVDAVEGIEVTMIDNGMPIVVLRAADMGITGYERPAELDADDALKARIEALRLACGPLMNLGDVREKSVPKMTMVAPAQDGGAFMTRSFIPHRCHDTIGVFAAVSAATAALLPASPVAALASIPQGARKVMAVEHPNGATSCVLECDDDDRELKAGMMRTTRKLFDGMIF